MPYALFPNQQPLHWVPACLCDRPGPTAAPPGKFSDGQLSDQNSFSGTGASLVYHKPNLLPIVESTQKGLATLRSLMRVNVMLMNVDDAEFMP